MWHWNSWWAPSPGDPPAIDDPVRWRSPWTAEQSLALQARSWDTWLSSSRAWWALWLAAWPMSTGVLSAEATSKPTGPALPPDSPAKSTAQHSRARVSREAVRRPASRREPRSGKASSSAHRSR